jgi:hypothetical protein
MAETQTTAKTVDNNVVTYDKSRFKLCCDTKQKETLKDLVKTKVIPLRIPTSYVFSRGEEAFFIDNLLYDQKMCETHCLDPSLIGQKVEHLRAFSVEYTVKASSLPGLEFKYVPDAKGKNIFGYVFDLRNGYINVTHLTKKYNLNFYQWLISNPDLIEKYCEATGLNQSELILVGVNTYILPGLCINFMSAVKPGFGDLMELMSNLLLGWITPK